jgi:xylan 1,4-beta-xylosidase
MPKTFQNPIIPGFYPDPSICCVGEDYYLVTSTFEYFPGVPIFHSRDLVHWRQIGHVLSRPSQLNLDHVPPSYGIFAATIRHHAGTFYVVTTWADVNRKLHNFFVTAADPAGAWSEPFFLADAPGIDPSLYFDADGRCWYAGNRTPTGADHRDTPRREIWLQELDLGQMQLTGDKYVLWDGMTNGEECPEAPHIYKIGDYYYLLVAEGGTYYTHCITIARSKNLTGPYEGCPRNPILTHRHLGLDYPISNVGHGDLVETQNGEWWMVLLGSRPYDGHFYNRGRETFLVPVAWEEDWPLVSPGSGRVEFSYHMPDLPEQRWPSSPACDHFEAPELALEWNFLRTPRELWWSLAERPGYLRLKLCPERLSEAANPSFIGRRQQHKDFAARTVMEFSPQARSECAGIALLQNKDFQLRCVCTSAESGVFVVRLERRAHGQEELIAEQPIPDYAGRLYFKVEAQGQAYHFYWATAAENWQALAEDVDGRILSTPVAEGFVGAYLGMYASSSGEASEGYADFDWFEYLAISS